MYGLPDSAAARVDARYTLAQGTGRLGPVNIPACRRHPFRISSRLAPRLHARSTVADRNTDSMVGMIARSIDILKHSYLLETNDTGIFSKWYVTKIVTLIRCVLHNVDEL
jgi:hypothetical protein